MTTSQDSQEPSPKPLGLVESEAVGFSDSLERDIEADLWSLVVDMVHSFALPMRFLMLLFAGWLTRHQQAAIDYLKAENAVLLELLGGRARLTDAQRRRLATRGHALGRGLLSEVAGIVRPDTILRWYRTLVALKYDGSSHQGPGRPRVATDLEDTILRMAVRTRAGATRASATRSWVSATRSLARPSRESSTSADSSPPPSAGGAPKSAARSASQ